jgi:excisionase family DNA binding protein
MLTLDELCKWLNITERHVRKMIERDAIPYRKVGHLLRFPEAEIEEWSHPARRPIAQTEAPVGRACGSTQRRRAASAKLPKSLIE